MVRGAYGERKLSDSGLDYTFANFQYTGIVQPLPRWQARYNFEANRTDDESTGLKTDRLVNGVDVIFLYPRGQLTGGYAYETNDDDRSLTYTNSWRAGATFHQGRWVTAKFDYTGGIRNDQEDLTLLKDVESSRIRGSLELKPVARSRFRRRATRDASAS